MGQEGFPWSFPTLPVKENAEAALKEGISDKRQSAGAALSQVSHVLPPEKTKDNR